MGKRVSTFVMKDSLEQHSATDLRPCANLICSSWALQTGSARRMFRNKVRLALLT
jgi:hypothetical protein